MSTTTTTPSNPNQNPPPAPLPSNPDQKNKKMREYLVLLPDKPAPHTLATRLAHRAAHLAHNRAHIDAQRITFGGPMLSAHDAPENEEGTLHRIIGSIHLCRAASAAEVWAMVAADPYGRRGVWDVEKGEVVPMRVLVGSVAGESGS
ncbi:hypothetical protein BP00DRAFT_414747 [Aspergillus indologenus CBS 114.80]|uniref:YCII-related domain-containing protein n=1 Tax=Aspergillus indologenus CBS 114.80 TaxID=1450541 RepID=A0A2V5I6G1_9EURO|nr:hypothetical protein BP00DRAFT_414747 [Aspergillus indologenus CBS 114.80]